MVVRGRGGSAPKVGSEPHLVCWGDVEAEISDELLERWRYVLERKIQFNSFLLMQYLLQ